MFISFTRILCSITCFVPDQHRKLEYVLKLCVLNLKLFVTFPILESDSNVSALNKKTDVVFFYHKSDSCHSGIILKL